MGVFPLPGWSKEQLSGMIINIVGDRKRGTTERELVDFLLCIVDTTNRSTNHQSSVLMIY